MFWISLACFFVSVIFEIPLFVIAGTSYAFNTEIADNFPLSLALQLSFDFLTLLVVGANVVGLLLTLDSTVAAAQQGQGGSGRNPSDGAGLSPSPGERVHFYGDEETGV